MRLKLLSFNIWQGKYLEELIDFLKFEKPDIIHIQEVVSHGSGLHGHELNVWQEIQDALKMNGVYKPIWEVSFGEVVSDLGEAILTKGELVDFEQHYYVGESGRKIPYEDFFKAPETIPRSLLVGKHKFEDVEITTLNTHFTWTPDASVTDYQLNAAAKLKELVDKYDRGIFSGDLNTLYGSEVYNLLSRDWVDVSEGERPTLHPKIHPVGKMKYHVDYIFYRGENIDHMETNIPVVDASDHLPLIAEFEIG